MPPFFLGNAGFFPVPAIEPFLSIELAEVSPELYLFPPAWHPDACPKCMPGCTDFRPAPYGHASDHAYECQIQKFMHP
jgi:hypothetical protein